jgi:hypothetical protein
MTTEKARENRARRALARQGETIRKSRARKYVPNLNDHGGYMIIDASRNSVIAGERFNLTLEDLEARVASYYGQEHDHDEGEDR